MINGKLDAGEKMASKGVEENKNEGLARCFICIEMPDEVVKEIARVQEEVGKRRFDGKMTELENLHLTLKFLGEIDTEKIEDVKKRLGEINFSEIECTLGEMGAFSYRGNPRIVWVKINGKGIFELQKKIDDALKGVFEREERFMSHLTVARVGFVKDKIGFVDYVKGMGVKKIKFKVGKFFLKQSELKSPGPVYTNLGEFEVNK
jgi:2'-5' RNA ligase